MFNFKYCFEMIIGNRYKYYHNYPEKIKDSSLCSE